MFPSVESFAIEMKEKAPPLANRMDPPQKVGALIALPGFRINGYESPFHGLLELPIVTASVHRRK